MAAANMEYYAALKQGCIIIIIIEVRKHLLEINPPNNIIIANLLILGEKKINNSESAK